MLLGKVFLLFAAVQSSRSRHDFALPAQAKIVVGKTYRNKESVDSLNCYNYRLKPGNVRWRFQHYHRITGTEVHDSYSFVGCGIEGKVSVGNKTFEWRSEPFNTMETNYPDGKWKVLGGEYSDDLSAGERKK